MPRNEIQPAAAEVSGTQSATNAGNGRPVMPFEQSQHSDRESEELSPEKAAPHERLLVIEPDVLTRWSLTTYLGRWFNVFAVASVDEGMTFLASQTPDSAVLSDALDLAQLARFESVLREKNPSATIIRLVTNPVSGGIGFRSESIEKPFRLSDVARMLHAPSRAKPCNPDTPRCAPP